ncbi:MAG: glycosyl hydrolase family 18 protein [Bacteroidia bacterium]|nr:glycosyl hydrolase family 18 protein [Bacteroidia bacterium]MDW8348072.1 glycosyl hydrolase family 18 protein [Bacteroidia bacterium]
MGKKSILYLLIFILITSCSIVGQSIHELQSQYYQQYKFSSEEEYDALYNFQKQSLSQYNKNASCTLQKRVMGYYPYWQGTYYTTMNYTSLSCIAYFSYEVNPSTGSYTTVHFWKTTNLIPQAHANGVKVVLCATLFGSSNLTTFLSNASARQRCIDSLVSLVQLRNADGVNIDFEGLPSSQKTNFTSFMNTLANEFHTKIPGSIVSIALPSVDWSNAYEVAAMTSVDEFYIMGYDYYYSGSSTAGPTGLLYYGSIWYTQCASKSINDYLIKGIPKSKLHLAVPYYGYEWATSSNAFNATTTGTGTSKTYATAKSNAALYGYNYESQSQSAYYMYNSGGWKQCWYDDSTSLSKKYDVVLQRDIGGIGIWALGYQGSNPELDNAIKNKFSTCGSVPCTYTFYDMGGPNGNYFNKEKWIYTINPSGLNQVQLQFTSFDLENNYDYLRIYDGADTTMPLLANLTGNTLPPIYNSSNFALTLYFTSDNATVKPGWVAQWTCSPVTNLSNNNLQNSQIVVYPNPVQERLFFSSPVQKIKVMDCMGRLIIEKGTDTQIYLGDIPSGVYQISLIHNNDTYQQKVIKY